MPPLGAALAAAGAVIAASPILTFAAQIGASLVLSAVAQRLQGRPSSSPSFEQRTSIRAPVVPRELVYGRVRKGGTIIFAHATRNGNDDYLHLIYALAGHQIDALEAVYFDGELAVDVAGGVIQQRYQDSVAIEWRLGSNNATPITNPFLPQDLWGPQHLCLGVPILYLRLRGSAEDFPNGLPNVTVLLRGKNDILDPRLGTRGYSSNAALCVADYMHDARFGLALPYGAEGGIDTASLIEAANVCDETVARAGGGTEARYAANGVMSSAETPKENIEGLLTAMGGRVLYSGDRWFTRAAAYRLPTVTLGPGDIREAGISVQTRRSRADNFNSVRGQFVAPENDWQPDDFPAVRSSFYLAEDRGVDSWRDLALPFTTSSGAAQRLAKIELERARRQQVIQVSGMLSAWRAKVGDTVLLTYPRWGYEAKPFEVRKATLRIENGALVPDLTLAEVSPLQFDWSASEEQIYAAAPPTNLPSPFEIGAPGAPSILEELYVTRGGVKGRLLISWSPSPGPFLDFYEVQARRTLTREGAATGEDWATLVRTTLTSVSRDDAALGTWEIRVQAVNTLGRRSAWSTSTAVVAGVTAQPQELEDVNLQSNGGNAVLTWRLPRDLDVLMAGRVLIRHSAMGVPTWANSQSYFEVAGSQTVAVVPLKEGSYLIRPIDSSGQLGPVTIRSTKGIQAVTFAPANSMVENPVWDGARTNVTVDAALDSLTLTDPTLPGLYGFDSAVDFGLVRAVRARSLIRMTALNLASTIDDRTALMDDWGDFDDTEGAFCDVVVEARFTDVDPVLNDWTDWIRLDSNEIAFRAVQARAHLISTNPDFNILVSELAIFFDEVT